MNIRTPRQLLVVGPLPPPLAGTSVSFQIFCQETHHHPTKVKLNVINSAPKHLGQTHLLTSAHFKTASRVLGQFCQQLRQSEQILIFGSNQFLSSLGTLCFSAAKLARKPCYIRAFGGSLDRHSCNLNPLFRHLFLKTLDRVDGLIVQTELLYNHFTRRMGDRVHLVPGYRYMPMSGNISTRTQGQSTKNLGLVFLGHVREEKGIFTLLAGLHQMRHTHPSIQCDIYGPIYPAIADCFARRLAQVPNANYKGVLKPEQVVSTLRQYDVLVFPSHYQGEGHPGVIIEAMMAGIPVITTAYRSIPEVVHDGINGLLVSPKDPRHLIAAIQQLHEDRDLLTQMAQNNWEMRTQYRAEHVTPRILEPMGIELVSH